MGREPSAGDLLGVYGRPLREQMVSMFGEEHADALVGAYREELAELDHLVRVFPEWPDVLRELGRRGYRLAVVTSKGRLFASRHLRLTGLDLLIEVVVTAADVRNHKPDPEPLLAAASRLRVRPQDCLVVGDSPYDLQAADRAGMKAALAEWGGFSREIFAAQGVIPDVVLKSPQGLLGLCPPLGAPDSGRRETGGGYIGPQQGGQSVLG